MEERIDKVCEILEKSIKIAYRNADIESPSNQMHVVDPIRVYVDDAETIVSVIRELKAENERLMKEKADAVSEIKKEQELNTPSEPIGDYLTSEVINFNYDLGYQDGLQKALDILKPSI